MWVARRSLTKPTYPGMLDNMVAGGMGFGHSPGYTVLKEAMEEATIPEEIARNAFPVGTISYTKLSGDRRETQPETQVHLNDIQERTMISLDSFVLVLTNRCCLFFIIDRQIVYDLELPQDFTPKPCDSEVQNFRLWTMDEVLDAIREGEFKPNCACVCLHFMIRHGVLTPENEHDYLEIDQRLHRRIEYPGPQKWPTFMEKH